MSRLSERKQLDMLTVKLVLHGNFSGGYGPWQQGPCLKQALLVDGQLSLPHLISLDGPASRNANRGDSRESIHAN